MLIGKDPVAALAATVTDPGTVSPASPVLLKFTTAPPNPAAFDRVTVQLPLAFAPSVVGLHCSDETTVEATKDMVDVCDVRYVAVTVTFWSVPTPELVAVKVAVVKPGATMTDEGTARLGLLLDIGIAAPPTGAAESRPTVQIEDPFACRDVGAQESDNR